MAKRTNPRLVGVFILGAIALLVAAVVVLGGGLLFKQQTRVVAYFQGSVRGLSVGAPVNIRGVRIGSVSDIVLEIDAHTADVNIPVYIDLDRSRLTLIGGTELTPRARAELIDRGLRAQLVSQSFVTGQLAVELDYFPGTPARLVGTDPNIPEIPTVPSGLEEMKNALAQLPLQAIADTAVRVLTAADTLLRSPQVEAAIAEGAGSLEELHGLLGEARPEVAPALRNIGEAAAQIRQAAEEAQAGLAQIRGEVGTVLTSATRLLDNGERRLATTEADLRAVSRSLEAALGQAQTTLAQINGLLAPRSPLRQDLETTMRNLSATSASLRGLASTLERNPNALLLGRPQR